MQWQPTVAYAGSRLEQPHVNRSMVQTPATLFGDSQYPLRRSQSGSKLKVIEELSSQIKNLQTELERAYEEIDRLKSSWKGSKGREFVKGSTGEEPVASSIRQYQNVSDQDIGKRSKGNQMLVQSHKQPSIMGVRSEILLEKASAAMKRECVALESSCVPTEVFIRDSNSFNDIFSSFSSADKDDRMASFATLPDRLRDFDGPFSTTAWGKDWNPTTVSETTSSEDRLDSSLRRDSFTYSDLSVAECFSDDVDSVSLGSIFDDVTIHSNDPIFGSFEHLYSDWQL
ncbi:hypothetical protein GAYE_SCF43G5633 [Galdieria yellowstonensis]|uniref:Uncharacterized protein n=1 Tax=Galdieria yellowstonensis TaxID=3028027 RepID=A0AAV9IJW1_9RHOD|nr:hypothetical protein GAYE_SCF43G5633 [Galdieria yellowstonensis]